jgi:hypothetical protein
MPEGCTIWSTGSQVELGGRGGPARFTASEQDAATAKRIAADTAAARWSFIILWGF